MHSGRVKQANSPQTFNRTKVSGKTCSFRESDTPRLSPLNHKILEFVAGGKAEPHIVKPFHAAPDSEPFPEFGDGAPSGLHPFVSVQADSVALQFAPCAKVERSKSRRCWGRYLIPEDVQRGGSPSGLAAVVTEQFWETWFDRAPDVIGRKLTVANVPFTVVGVMPKRFTGADPTRRP